MFMPLGLTDPVGQVFAFPCVWLIKLTRQNMDEELRDEISKIVSLARDTDSILPNLNPQQCGSKHVQQPNPSKKRLNEDDPADPPPSKRPTSRKNRKYLGMKAGELHFRIVGDKVVEFCQQHGLVAKEMKCSCGNPMQLLQIDDKDYVWTCSHKSHTLAPRQTIRKGTWFEHSDVSLYDTLFIAYMWLHEYSPTSMLHECRNSSQTLVKCCEYCLDVCKEIMEHKRSPIGGEGRSVEIFECKITRDKKPTEKWAFCGIEQLSPNTLELLLNDKKPVTLAEIFYKYFLPGTKVVTHNWTPFKNLHEPDFLHFVNDKSILFYDVVTKKDMNTFEDFKKATHRPPPGLNKWSKLEYGPSFFEKMYRKSLIFAPDAFLAYLTDIAMIYKPVDKFVKSSSKKPG